jgi:PilZ domain-containing protein
MWQQIKALFSGSSSGPPVVIEPVTFDDGLLLFKAREPLKLKKTKIAGPCKKGYLEFEVDVLSHDEQTGQYRAKLDNETFSLDAMQIKKPKGFRLEVGIPVSSPEVKGEIRTEDLALSGCRLLLKQELQRGAHITIKLHWNDPLFDDLELRSEVKWCCATRKGLYHCAVRFFMIDKAQRTIIKRFIQNRAALGG